MMLATLKSSSSRSECGPVVLIDLLAGLLRLFSSAINQKLCVCWQYDEEVGLKEPLVCCCGDVIRMQVSEVKCATTEGKTTGS